MPNDLRRPRTTRSLTHLTPLRIFLLCFVSAVYALLAIRFSLPPHNWLEAYVHRKYDLNDKVLHHRPAFRGVERYSPEHKYRPATSPIVTQVGKDGKVTYKGKYH
ncbi:uncharacterized protein JCM6883_004646 [Sporobolomyces salmoneus]|uniref:uncharacterized protein n=1 Tax=Sporobolomyces salmoneus TaxID=183962 RepID=UPI003171D4C1